MVWCWSSRQFRFCRSAQIDVSQLPNQDDSATRPFPANEVPPFCLLMGHNRLDLQTLSRLFSPSPARSMLIHVVRHGIRTVYIDCRLVPMSFFSIQVAWSMFVHETCLIGAGPDKMGTSCRRPSLAGNVFSQPKWRTYPSCLPNCTKLLGASVS